MIFFAFEATVDATGVVVVGAEVVGAAVVGAAVVGALVGLAVVGAAVVVGAEVVGAEVVGGAVVVAVPPHPVIIKALMRIRAVRMTRYFFIVPPLFKIILMNSVP